MRKEVLVILLLCLIPVMSSLEITECMNITSSGTYTLTADILDYPGTCFNISSDNVILDGNGKKVTGDAGAYIYGIWAKEITNLTVKNFEIITTFVDGSYFENIELLTLENNTIYSNWVSGIVLESIIDSTIYSNNISKNDAEVIKINNCFETNISENKIFDNSVGIKVYNSEKTSFSTNEIISSSDWGLEIDSSPNTTIRSNNISENSGGVKIIRSENSLIENNFISDLSSGTINGDLSKNLTIKNNELKNLGIYLEYCENSLIIDNNVSEGSMWGIYLGSSPESNISYNNASLNGVHGIFLENSSDSFIVENIINENSVDGINLDTSNRSSIINNKINLNGVSGIDITSEQARIEDNEFIGNVVWGVSIWTENTRIEIINNKIGFNKVEGIYIYEGEDIKILNNEIYSHENIGINFDSGGIIGSLIEGNNIYNNTITGIFLDANVIDTKIRNNNFSDNPDYNILSEIGAIENKLIYYNDYGEIYFNEPEFLENITLEAENIRFNNNIQIGKGWAYLKSDELETLNKSAQITLNLSEFTNLDGNIYRNGEICNEDTSPSCVLITSFSDELLIFNVSSWSNYSIKEEIVIQEEESDKKTSSTTKYNPKINALSATDFENGKELNLKNLDKIRFKISSNQDHTFTLMQFNQNSANIKIESDPIIAWIEKGVNYEFDLNNDGTNDILVRYEGINLNPYGAKIFLQEINQEERLDSKEVSEEIPIQENKNYNKEIIIGFIVILFIVIIFLSLNKKKKPTKYKK